MHDSRLGTMGALGLIYFLFDVIGSGISYLQSDAIVATDWVNGSYDDGR